VQERAIDATKIFKHRDYELVCGARRVDNGKFAPTLMISKQVWPTRPREIAVRTSNSSLIEKPRSSGFEPTTHHFD